MLVFYTSCIMHFILARASTDKNEIPPHLLEVSLRHVNELLENVDEHLNVERKLLSELENDDDDDNTESGSQSETQKNKIKRKDLVHGKVNDWIKMRSNISQEDMSISEQDFHPDFPCGAVALTLQKNLTEYRRRMRQFYKYITKSESKSLMRHFILKHASLFNEFLKHFRQYTKHKRRIKRKHHSSHRKKHQNGHTHKQNAEILSIGPIDVLQENDQKLKEVIETTSIKPINPIDLTFISTPTHNMLRYIQTRFNIAYQEPAFMKPVTPAMSKELLTNSVLSNRKFNPPKINKTTSTQKRHNNKVLEKIFEGSSYSDEEPLIKTMLIEALVHECMHNLKYGPSTRFRSNSYTRFKSKLFDMIFRKLHMVERFVHYKHMQNTKHNLRYTYRNHYHNRNYKTTRSFNTTYFTAYHTKQKRFKIIHQLHKKTTYDFVFRVQSSEIITTGKQESVSRSLKLVNETKYMSATKRLPFKNKALLKIIEESSYSDEEIYLRTKLKDALLITNKTNKTVTN